MHIGTPGPLSKCASPTPKPFDDLDTCQAIIFSNHRWCLLMHVMRIRATCGSYKQLCRTDGLQSLLHNLDLLRWGALQHPSSKPRSSLLLICCSSEATPHERAANDAATTSCQMIASPTAPRVRTAAASRLCTGRPPCGSNSCLSCAQCSCGGHSADGAGGYGPRTAFVPSC